MPERKKGFTTMDEYITAFPPDVRRILQEVRRTIRTAVPDAVETISYQIPTFKLRGRNLVYFAGWKNHVSIYPIPSGDATFKKEISPYKKGRGTLQFPLDKPVPYALVRRITALLVKENLARKR